MALIVVTSQQALVRVYDAMPVTVIGSFPPVPEFGNEVTAGFLDFGGTGFAGEAALPLGWDEFIVDLTVIDPLAQGEFYIAYELRDAAHVGIRYSWMSLKWNLSHGQHQVTNQSGAWSTAELASARYIACAGTPTGAPPQSASSVLTFTPRLSVTFTGSEVVPGVPPGGDWTALDYDDSSWQWPATDATGVIAGAPGLPPFEPPDSVAVTHALARYPQASVGERVYFRQGFTLPAGIVVSGHLLAHVEDATPIGIYVNGTQLAASSIIEPSLGDVFNIVTVAVPVELLNPGPSPLAEFGDPVIGDSSTGYQAAGSSPIAAGWDQIFVTYSIDAADNAGLFYIKTYFRDADGNDLAPEQNGNPRMVSLTAPLTEEQSYLDAADRAAVRTIQITSQPAFGDAGPWHWTPRVSATFVGGGDNVLALCVENTSGSALQTAYRLEINQAGDVPPIGGCVPVDEFGGDTLGSFNDGWQLAGRQFCTSGWTQFSCLVGRGTDGTAGEAFITLVFEDTDQNPVNPSYGTGVLSAILEQGEEVAAFTNFEFGTPEDRDAIRFVSLWNRPTGAAPQNPDTDYPIDSTLSLTFSGCGPATGAQHPQVVWVM